MALILTVLAVAVFAATAYFLISRELAVRRARQAGFLDKITLRQMSWQDYSLLVNDYFVREGYLVFERPMHGADFELRKGERRWLVSCGHWRAAKVDEKAVRELFQIIAARSAYGGFLLSCGTISTAARQFASGKNIELIGGDRLVSMMEEAQRGEDVTASRHDAVDEGATVPRRVILCPLCGRSMVKKTERTPEGTKEYFGCSRAPACKGRRNIA